MNRKSKSTTFLLCYFFGMLGVHRFYLNKILTGILMLISVGGFGIWWLIDMYLISVGRMQDKQGEDLFTGPPDPNNPNAGFWVRLAAISVDGIIAGFIIVIIAYVPFAAAVYLELLSESEQELAAFAVTLIELLIYLIYMALPLTRQHQATPGKRCFDLYVTTKDGKSVGMLQALWRTFSYIISAIPLFLGFIMAGFKKKQALHDLLAGTQVLYVMDSGSQSISVAETTPETEIISDSGSNQSPVTRTDSQSTRWPIIMLGLGAVLLLAAAALALL